jgi:hypothetical protein
MTGFKLMRFKVTGFKLALSGAAAFAALSASVPPAQAAIEYPWCVQYGAGMDGGGGRTCGFVSYEQCMMTARGAGGSCEQNLFYLDQVAKQRQQPRKRLRGE